MRKSRRRNQAFLPHLVGQKQSKKQTKMNRQQKRTRAIHRQSMTRSCKLNTLGLWHRISCSVSLVCSFSKATRNTFALLLSKPWVEVISVRSLNTRFNEQNNVFACGLWFLALCKNNNQSLRCLKNMNYRTLILEIQVYFQFNNVFLNRFLWQWETN